MHNINFIRKNPIEFDNAMKDEVSTGGYIKNTDPASFISGSGRSY